MNGYKVRQWSVSGDELEGPGPFSFSVINADNFEFSFDVNVSYFENMFEPLTYFVLLEESNQY